MVDVVVEVGDWEHECCGEAVERNQLVDLWCIRHTGPDGVPRLVESHHGGLSVAADVRVRGRVVDLHVVLDGGDVVRINRVPSGRELAAGDDGLLEEPWTGEPVPSGSYDFRVTVRTSRQP